MIPIKTLTGVLMMEQTTAVEIPIATLHRPAKLISTWAMAAVAVAKIPKIPRGVSGEEVVAQVLVA